MRFAHGRPVGATDPLFGQDVAVYAFTLPFLRFLEGWIAAALLLAMLGSLAAYGVLLVGGWTSNQCGFWRPAGGASSAICSSA